MRNFYKDIVDSAKAKNKLLAVLIDPDKFPINDTKEFINNVNSSIITHIFVGGTIVKDFQTELVVSEIKKYTDLPIILFPGDTNQITSNADAILFLSLISGNNPDYLIGKQVRAVRLLKETNLEIIPTGYLLIEGQSSAECDSKQAHIEKVTDTIPLLKNEVQRISDTAKAGEYLGMKLIYLEAGSGALAPISTEIIESVKKDISIPIVVGGGIKTSKQLDEAYQAGADLVVIGTILEEDKSFFKELNRSLRLSSANSIK